MNIGTRLIIIPDNSIKFILAAKRSSLVKVAQEYGRISRKYHLAAPRASRFSLKIIFDSFQGTIMRRVLIKFQ